MDGPGPEEWSAIATAVAAAIAALSYVAQARSQRRQTRMNLLNKRLEVLIWVRSYYWDTYKLLSFRWNRLMKEVSNSKSEDAEYVVRFKSQLGKVKSYQDGSQNMEMTANALYGTVPAQLIHNISSNASRIYLANKDYLDSIYQKSDSFHDHWSELDFDYKTFKTNLRFRTENYEIEKQFIGIHHNDLSNEVSVSTGNMNSDWELLEPMLDKYINIDTSAGISFSKKLGELWIVSRIRRRLIGV